MRLTSGKNGGMKHLLSSIAKYLAARADQGRQQHDAEIEWRKDPLSHPAIKRMTMRELADLPFDPHCIEPD